MGRINKEKALEIAREHALRVELDIFDITDSLPPGCSVYNAPKDCWYISCSYNLPFHALTSSRLICVSKTTGEVVYDGSANDEG